MKRRVKVIGLSIISGATLGIGLLALAEKQNAKAKILEEKTRQEVCLDESRRAELADLGRSLSLWRSHVSNYVRTIETITETQTSLASLVIFDTPLRSELVHPIVLFRVDGEVHRPTSGSGLRFDLDVPKEVYPLVDIQGFKCLLSSTETVETTSPGGFSVAKEFRLAWCRAYTFHKRGGSRHFLVGEIPRTVGFWSWDDEKIGYYDPSGHGLGPPTGPSAYKTVAKVCFFSWPQRQLLGTLRATGMPPEDATYTSHSGLREALTSLDKIILEVSVGGSDYFPICTSRYTYANPEDQEGDFPSTYGLHVRMGQGALANFRFMATSHGDSAAQ